MMRLLVALGLLGALLLAQEDIEDRVARLEKLLEQERTRGTQREERIRELENALRKTTDALARAQDRRQIEAEIDSYLNERVPVGEPAGGPSRLNIGAVIVASFRATEFDGNTPSTNSFQVEDRYLRFVYRYSDSVTARYYTDGSLAELEYHHSDLIQVNFGVVVVPFGQFNPRSFPDTFDTLSRPLLFLGDQDTFATPANNPTAVFRSIYSDTGLVLSGNLFGGEEAGYDQIYYAVWVTNGLVGVSDLAGSSGFSDNNQNKQVGARISLTSSRWFERARVGFGLSWMTGKYDRNNSLSYRMYGGDVLIVIDNMFKRGEGSVTIRGEYVFAPREILAGTIADPTILVNDASRVQGAYLILEARLDTRWMVYVEADWLTQAAPLRSGGLLDPANPTSVNSRILRYSLGLVRKLELGIIWKLEYAFWDFDRGAPDAHRLSTQIVVPF